MSTDTSPLGCRPRAERAPPAPVGARVGAYTVEAHLGGGGYGEIYRARADDGRVVALKALRPELAREPRALEAFFNEARAVNHIDHPDIVRIHDHVKVDEEGHWLVMELLEGRSLRAALREGPLRLDHALRLAGQVAGVLANTHGLGIAHCDLKPENIFLVDDDQRARLLDFGVARLPVGAGGRAGTLGYMAPEQLAGHRANAASDVFSLGVTLFEAIQGERPFTGRSRSQLSVQVLTRAPPALCPPDGSLVPGVVASLVEEMLERHPARRPTAAEVRRRVEEIVPPAPRR